MITPHIFKIKGMHCASCASIIEKSIKKIEGIESISVNYGTETAHIVFDDEKTPVSILSKEIEPLGYSFLMPMNLSREMQKDGISIHHEMRSSKHEKLAELHDMRMKVYSVIPLAIFSILVMAWDMLAQVRLLAPPVMILTEFFHHLLPIFATYTLFVVGKPYLLGFYRFLRHGAANMDTLIGIGTSVAFLYSLILSAFEEPLARFVNTEHTYYDVTIVVIAFITLGKYLEAKAKLKTGDAIEKLLNLQAKTARVIRQGKEQEIPTHQVMMDDEIVIKPGSSIPVDGVIIEGSSYVDESMVTGESMPIEKNVGDTVVAGTMNTTGSFIFRATKIGAETLLAKIITMVETAQGTRAPIQALADKISGVFVPVVLVLAFATLAIWLIVGTSLLGFSQALSFGLTSFVGILVIACPCALGLATPTAIIVGVGKGAKEGILIKDAATLEKLHKVDIVVVDKTGTITKGKPELVRVVHMTDDLSEAETLSILASLETKSEHPIADAITSYAKANKIELQEVKGFHSIHGKGVTGMIGKTEYFAGNRKLLADLELSLSTTVMQEETSQGKTPVILATKESVLAIVFVADAIKPQAIQAVKDLHALGIKIIMLTGDTQNTARAIADEVGIDEVIAEVMPEDKLRLIRELQSKGHLVAMAGDGVNDAPALAQADVGIAMGTGTDVAIETAGITLLQGDISKLAKAIRLSKITMTGIKQNLFWAFLYNIIGIPLAAGLFYPFFGWLLNPVFAGLAMAFSSVSVVSNSLRLKTKKL